ncbi:MAG: hypothetical protein EB060_10560 [Proteobacteria bacterium]|nr:hypothetical protein [Pseudomonadota bacterium]
MAAHPVTSIGAFSVALCRELQVAVELIDAQVERISDARRASGDEMRLGKPVARELWSARAY